MSKFSTSRREFVLQLGAVGGTLLSPPATARPARSTEEELAYLKAGWLDPPRSYKPHTRWWWPGSAVTIDGIDWQLEQMKAQGIGGVEICCVWEMYQKGNIPYLSDKWLAMVRHAIEKAAELDMNVALTFGPGWDLGGSWIPPEQRSKVLTSAHTDIDGPRDYTGSLPAYKIPSNTGRNPWVDRKHLDSSAPDQHQLVAVVAGRLDGGRLDAASLTVITSRVTGDTLDWHVPAGKWRVCVYRLQYTGQQNSAQNFIPRNWVLDPFNKDAVLGDCDHLNAAFARGFGEWLGKTVDSYFVDSWEIAPLSDTILWSNSLLDDFKAYTGYDLTPYLPAVWFDIGPLTPHIRYDVNRFLGWVAIEWTFRPLIETMARYHVPARIQPHYRFTEEIIQGAGITPRPETEVTTARFATIADPRKATAAGARFYGNAKFISAEAYTFLHPERYRTTLEEMKRATDAFLRDGVTQFYNHGYVYTPEMGPAPSRDIPWANRISHINTWWRYYHHLAEYVARCCFLLRQGQFVGDVLLYSPQATAWTERVVWGIERRIMDYGDVPQTLVANGYDYDLVNDDILQHRARAQDARIRIRDLSYRVLILPAIKAMPVATLRFISRFVSAGGTVIALASLPTAAVGLRNHQARDAEVVRLVKQLRKSPHFHFLPGYRISRKHSSPSDQQWRPMPALNEPQKKLLNILRAVVPPDFALAGNAQSNGLTYLHRRVGDIDVYFVTNLQPSACRRRVTFRVSGKQPETWNPMTGDITAVAEFRSANGGTEIPIELTPWGSTIIAFRPGKRAPKPAAPKSAPARKPLPIAGSWKLVLASRRFPRLEKQMTTLASWTADPATRHFSGTGVYETGFELPADYLSGGARLTLDLGRVADVAEVWLNGREAGVRWMQPYRLDVTRHLQAGTNHLKVLVTNTLINEVTGMKEPPPVPAELIPHYGGEGNRYSIGRARFLQEKKVEPPASGLLGPVRLLAG